MTKAFDIGIETLAPNDALTPEPTHLSSNAQSLSSLSSSAISSNAANGKSFFIETFGWPMNVHDAEKVAGVLLARGYRAAGSIAEADLMLYNTCSIRQKAEQKVFSRLGEWRYTIGTKVIGVIGCLAQQEGEDIFERAPWVSLVCGSASYRKLPDLIDQLESGGRRVMGLDLDTDETFETEVTRRDNPLPRLHYRNRRLRLRLLVLRCAAHARTRTQPRQRCGDFRGAPACGRGLHRNSIARPDGEFLSRSLAARPEFLRAAARSGRRRGNSPRAVYDIASERFSRARSSKQLMPSPRFAITSIFRCNRGPRASCAPCAALTRARNISKKSHGFAPRAAR